MPNKDGHRRFGNIRELPSGRFQIRYPGPDGRLRTGRETYERKSDADRALVLIEAQISAGQWTDPERVTVKVADYGLAWIEQRPGLRPWTADFYRWLFGKHILPYVGGVPLGKLTPGLIRERQQGCGDAMWTCGRGPSECATPWSSGRTGSC